MMRRRSLLFACVVVAGCELRDAQQQDAAVAAAAAQQGQSARPAGVRPPAGLPERFDGIGRPARVDEVRAWDIDVNPEGVGLPRGRGTSAQGAQVYARQCASCHGAQGEGIAPNPRLVGAQPTDFSFASDPKIGKTIGNYWPYATTLYDYINRAMPLAAPGTLTPSEVYAVVAYLLAENGVIDRAAVMDARSLPRVRMPARDRFVRDNRSGGATFR